MADTPRGATRSNWLWLIIVAVVALGAIIWWSSTHRGEDIGGQIAMESADMGDSAPTDAAPTQPPRQPR